MDTNLVRQQNMANYQKLRNVVERHLKKAEDLDKPFNFLTGIPIVDKIYAVSGKYSSKDFIHALHMDVLELYDSSQKERSKYSCDCIRKALDGKSRYKFNYTKMNDYCDLGKNLKEPLYKLILDKGIELSDSFWLPKQMLNDIRDYVRAELFFFLTSDNPWREDDLLSEDEFERMRECVKNALLEENLAEEDRVKKERKEFHYSNLLAQYAFLVMYLIEYANQYTYLVETCTEAILQEKNRLDQINNINILITDMSESIDFISNMLSSIGCYSTLLWQLEFYNFGALRMNVAGEDQALADKIWLMMEDFYSLCHALHLSPENMFIDERKGARREDESMEKDTLTQLCKEVIEADEVDEENRKEQLAINEQYFAPIEPPEIKSIFTQKRGFQLQKERMAFVERNYEGYNLRQKFDVILEDYFKNLLAWMNGTCTDMDIAQSEIYFTNEYSDMVRE